MIDCQSLITVFLLGTIPIESLLPLSNLETVHKHPLGSLPLEVQRSIRLDRYHETLEKGDQHSNELAQQLSPDSFPVRGPWTCLVEGRGEGLPPAYSAPCAPKDSGSGFK